jgi:hypothetical protein
MIPLAHILGIPVEETAGMIVPVAALTMGALSVSIRHRWRDHRLRGARAGRRARR